MVQRRRQVQRLTCAACTLPLAAATCPWMECAAGAPAPVGRGGRAAPATPRLRQTRTRCRFTRGPGHVWRPLTGSIGAGPGRLVLGWGAPRGLGAPLWSTARAPGSPILTGAQRQPPITPRTPRPVRQRRLAERICRQQHRPGTLCQRGRQRGSICCLLCCCHRCCTGAKLGGSCRCCSDGALGTPNCPHVPFGCAPGMQAWPACGQLLGRRSGTLGGSGSGQLFCHCCSARATHLPLVCKIRRVNEGAGHPEERKRRRCGRERAGRSHRGWRHAERMFGRLTVRCTILQADRPTALAATRRGAACRSTRWLWPRFGQPRTQPGAKKQQSAGLPDVLGLSCSRREEDCQPHLCLTHYAACAFPRHSRSSCKCRSSGGSGCTP